MPPVEEMDCYQDRAVLWPAGSYDRYSELQVEDVGRQINVRWISSTEQLGPNVDAVAYVLEPIAEGSLMWHGAAEDLPGTSFAEEDETLMEVVAYHEQPDVNNRVTRRWVDLKRYRDSHPPMES